MPAPPTSRRPVVPTAVVKWLLIGLVLVYVALMLLSPQLGPSDEYHFLPTLLQGKPFPFYNDNFPYYSTGELGRFSPLAGQEYNLIWPFTSSPYGYFLLNAIELLVVVGLCIWLLNEFCQKRALNYAAVLFLLLIPGTTLTFTKLLYVEKNVLLLFAAFLAAYVFFLKNEKPVYLIATLVTANLAIYYKETAFLAIGAFAASRLLLTWRAASRRHRFLNMMLVLCSVIYFVLYLILIFPHRSSATYAAAPVGSTLVALAKNIANYGLFSDPVVILLILPLVGWRLYEMASRRREAHPVLDPMLLAGSAYVGAYVLLNMYGPYYFLPAYVFILPPMVYFLSQGLMSGLVWRGLFLLTALVLTVNAIPAALHYLSYNKYVAQNFNKTLDFLIQDIERQPQERRVNIFLDGVDRGNGRGVYFILGEYLKYRGLSIRRFDMRSEIETPDAPPFVGKASPFDIAEDVSAVDPNHLYKYPQFPFAVFQPGPGQRIQRGDYLVVSPQSTRGYDREYIEALKKDHTLVFHTESLFAVPRFDLKTWVKYYLSKRLSPEQKGSGLMLNENLWNWPDYYVFVRN